MARCDSEPLVQALSSTDGQYEPPAKNLAHLELNGWGYRWIRLRRSA